MEHFAYYLIVDLEATCCDQGSVPKHAMETIEIGAVMVEADTWRIVDEFCTFIRPVRYPRLTPFCTALTTIEQHQVDVAPSYPDAIQLFKTWLYQYDNFVFCSWGDYDRIQLERDSQYHQVAFPVSAQHINIKKRFSKTQGLKRKFGMNKALQQCGLTLEGVHHRGIDDAKNMARMLPYIFGGERVQRQLVRSS